jgi:hypothetical protein
MYLYDGRLGCEIMMAPVQQSPQLAVIDVPDGKFYEA